MGSFLFSLKQCHDENYKDFFNGYGDLTYCQFKLTNERLMKAKGLYAFMLHGDLKYIGRCRDSFKSRLNAGYGQISPKNCYIDGQATNCHINNVVHKTGRKVTFHVFPMNSDAEIEDAEVRFIQEFQPEWNIALKS